MLSPWRDVAAEPNLTGQTGLINMPDGRVESDGTWRLGYSFQRPYSSVWTNVTLIPRVEATARFTRIMYIPGFEGNQAYGDYKDKVFQGKFMALEESDALPAVSIGFDDYFGTGLFSSRFVAMSKRLGPLDLSLGYGRGRIDGAFGGLRAKTGVPGLSVVAEYDAINYAQDLLAAQTHVAQRKKGPAYGLEYRWGWLGTQVSYRDGEAGINAYVSVPLNDKEFVPKFEEPAPYTEITRRPSLAQWHADPAHARRLADALYGDDFRNVRLRLNGRVLEAELTNARIALASRAVGRAARILLLLSPHETRELRITWTQAELPVATYGFFDLERLRRYFNGQIGRRELAGHVTVDYADPRRPRPDEGELWASFDDARSAIIALDNHEGDLVALRRNDATTLDNIHIAPKLGTYLNDPGGPFRYEVFLNASYEKRIGRNTFLNLEADLTLAENISGITQQSNSELPHVRSDVAEYKKGGKLKLNRAMVTRYFHPQQRVYARASAGIYEEMFAGAGGQMLYLPRRKPWAVDLAVDWVRQRDTRGRFGFRDYSTVTAIAGVHYRLPIPGLTGTVRAGRFLARDWGAQFEIKRRFKSGIEMGAWYTLTNGNDVVSPGAPGSPYHDKGVFLSIPLNVMLPYDTRATSSFALSPWSRDVGQMLAAPDLYELLEKPFLNAQDRDGLRYFGDSDDDYSTRANTTALDRLKWEHFRHDLATASDTLISEDAVKAVGKGLGVVLLSNLLDRPADKIANTYRLNPVFRAGDAYGKWSPLIAMGVSGLLALDQTDERLNTTAFSSVKAGALALLATEGGKWLVGRSRPAAGRGGSDFHWFGAASGDSSFPSNHVSVMWAAVTPYALEYEMPWLYGVAALTNLGRMAGRQHWFSDTVAGALVGYAAGNLMWESQRRAERKGPNWMIAPNGVAAAWQFD